MTPPSKTVTVYLPYVKVLSETIEMIFYDPYDISTVFRSGSTLRKHLLQVGQPMEENMTEDGVHSIPCSFGMEYNREPCRPFKLRLQEHRKEVTRGEIEKSGMADHM